MRKAATPIVGGLMLASAVVAVAAPAVAGTGNHGRDCTALVHRDLDDVKTTGDATTKLLAHGVRATTPNDPDSVMAYFSDTKGAKLAWVQSLSYRTYKYDKDAPIVAPAYQIAIDKNGGELEDGDFTTLVYEPYVDGKTVQRGKWQTWYPSNGVWWSTRSIPGQPTRDVRATLREIVKANPDATVLYYGVKLGTYNKGADAAFDTVKISLGKKCTVHSWTKVPPTVSPSAPASPSVTPTPTASASATPTMNPPVSEPPPSSGPDASGTSGNDEPTLPVTGNKVWLAAAFGGALLGIGAGLVFFFRRRRQVTFTA